MSLHKLRSVKSRLGLSGNWSRFTADDLIEWAGAHNVRCGRHYQRKKYVRNLAISGKNKIVATVRGTERYATVVELTRARKRSERLQSRCSCPVGHQCGCKHAVAVVAEYLQRLKEGQEVPTAADDDPRWESSEAGGEWRNDEMTPAEKLQMDLDNVTHEELLDFVMQIANSDSDLMESMQKQAAAFLREDEFA